MSFAFVTRLWQAASRNWRRQASDLDRRLGAAGERIAVRHLKKKRYRVLARNYQCVAGEIDVIAADRDTIVFVEVKTRSSEQAFGPDFAITPFQRGQIERAARYFLMERRVQHLASRFDVVTVCRPAQGPVKVQHFEDAFKARRG